MAAKGGKLQQFKASFNAFQFEIVSQNQSPAKMVKPEPIVRPDDTGLESLVKALQEEAFVIRAELADWKNKANTATQENASVKEGLEKTITKLSAEVEGWRDRAAMSAGKGIVARRQLEDFGRQVKVLKTELQQLKEESLKLQGSLEAVQKENEDLRADLNEWKQKADASAKETESLKSEVNWSIKVLEADLEKWKHIATNGNIELEHSVRDLRAEVEEWEKVAGTADEQGKSVKMADFSRVRKSEDELEDRSCNSSEGRTMKEDEMDCSSQTSGRTSNEWRDGSSELEMSFQAEIEDLKSKVISAEKEHSELEMVLRTEIEDSKKKLVSAEKEHSELETTLRAEIEDSKKKLVSAEKDQERLKLHYETRVKELQLEVEAWMSEARITEADKIDRLELEKKLKDSQVKAREALEDLVHERKRSTLQMAELRAELKNWKVVAADAAEECSSLRVAFDNVTMDLHLELTQWKAKAETFSEEGKSVKAALEKVVEDLQSQVLVWKEKAENALEEVAKNQDLQSQVLVWKGKAESALEEVAKNQDLQSQMIVWKGKAESALQEVANNHHLQSQLLVWKGKAERALEVVAKNQKYAESVKNMEAELSLWKQRTQEGLSLQLEMEEEQLQLMESLTETQNELQNWKDRAAAVTRSIRSLQGDSSSEIAEGDEEDIDSISIMHSEIHKWKSKAREGEKLQLHLKNMLAETQKESYEWKQKAAAVTLATESLKEELDCVIEEGRLERDELCNSISDLEEALFVWRERAQECQSLQTQFKNSEAELTELKETLKTSQSELKEWKDKAVAITLTTRSLMEELDFRTEEGLQEKQEFCNSISTLKESVLGWKEKAAESESMILEIRSNLLETQVALRDWKDRATSVAMIAENLKAEMNCTLEDYRLEKEELCNTINELEAEVYEWKARAQDGVTVQRQLERALSELEKKKRPLLRAHRSSSISSL